MDSSQAIRDLKRHEQQEVPGEEMKTYYVMVSGGSFKDRYEVKIKAKDASEAISLTSRKDTEFVV